VTKLSEAQRRDYTKHLDNLDAVLQLAAANFPRSNEVDIKTVGSSPNASIRLHYYILSFLVEAGRRSLQDSGESRG
jgi:hypothetical protein